MGKQQTNEFYSRRKSVQGSKRLTHETLEARRMLARTAGLEFAELNVAAEQFLAQARPVQPFEPGAVTLDAIQSRAAALPYKPDEVVVAISAPGKSSTHDLISAAWDSAIPDQPASSRLLFASDRPDGTSVELYSVTTTLEPLQAAAELFGESNVLWASPSFIYQGEDPRDAIPSDPRFGDQYHHDLMQNPEAWDTTFGESNIVIAVTDDGFDVDHEDLADNIWVNPGEIAGNGIDDDNNGYIDDVGGWDFIDQDNDVDPNGGQHGTHVAGIAAASTDNDIGIAGTAGGSTIMPLRFFDGSDVSTFTSSMIAETYSYAADNGAHIINTSYSIDYFVGDPVYTAGVQYAYDQGVLHFNSAGNDGRQDPWRLEFEQKIFVSNTDESDVMAFNTNYGDGVDISAPGVNILSTSLSDGYRLDSGTSMSTPNAAGVAALIWSQNPTWTRDQVVAQLLQTTDSLVDGNPLKADLLGSGRVNAFRALSETLGSPVIAIEGLPEDGGQILTESDVSFSLRYSQIIDPAGVNSSGFIELVEAGIDQLFDTADDVTIPLEYDTYFVGTNVTEIEIPDILEFGDYRLTIDADVASNPFGLPLDGNADGTGGDDHVRHFRVAPPAFSAQTALGGLIHSTNFATSVRLRGEVDRYSYDFQAGQTVSGLIDAVSGLVPRVQIVDPNGTVILDVTSADTSTVHFESVPILTSGNHNILVESSTVAAGDYEATFLLNSAFDSEVLSGGAANDSQATSQPLAAHTVSLGTSASQTGIVGQLSDTDSDDWFAIDLADGQFTSLIANSDDPNYELTLELYDAAGTLLASGMQTGNASAIISAFLDKTSDAQNDTYHVRLTGVAEQYQLMALIDSDFDSELQNEVQEWTAPSLLGFVTSNFSGSAEPDDATEGNDISDAFADVTLSDVYGADVVARATLQASTGLLVFAPNSINPEWKSGEHELRADFDTPVDFASIDVITNDASDVAVLRAYDRNQNLLETIYSNVALPGAPASMGIVRAAADISSIVVTGAGNDSVVLDNLEFGRMNGTDAFTFDVQSNDIIDIVASSPVGGPYQFNGELFESGNESIGLRLFDPSGSLLTSGTTTLGHTATQAGAYEVQVFSNDRSGEYLLEFAGLAPTSKLPSVTSATPTDGSPLGQFPSTITLAFSEAIDLSTVDASDFQINGMPAQSVSSSANEVTIIVDPGSQVAGAQQTLDVAAGVVMDLQGLGNEAFTDTFIVRSIEPFEPLGPEGSLSYISTTEATLDNAGNLKRFSFFAHQGESLSAMITPDGSARLTAEFLGLSSQVSANSNGQVIFLDSIESTSDQAVTLIVRTNQATDFTVELIRNASIGDLVDDSSVFVEPSLDSVTNARFNAVGSIVGTANDTDTFIFDLTGFEGSAVDFAIQGESTAFSGQFEIYDPLGDLVTTSGSTPLGSSFDQAVFDFVPELDGDYTVIVKGEWDGTYAISVSAGYYLGDVNNDQTVRNLNPVEGATGYLQQGETDSYEIQLVGGATLSLNLDTPLDSSSGVDTNELVAVVSVTDSMGNVVLPPGSNAQGSNRVLNVGESGIYTIHVEGVENLGEYVLRSQASGSNFVDFNLDGVADCADINGLVASAASGTYDPSFDLNDDGSLNRDDITLWLSEAALFNGLTLPYLPGDANLDGVIDVSDFNAWNSNRFTFNSGWCTGDFTADGVIDVTDFNIWNMNKFMSGLALNLTVSDLVVDEGEPAIFELSLSRTLQVPGRVNLIARSDTATGSVDFDNYGFEYSEDGGVTWIPTSGLSGSEVIFALGVDSLLVRIDTFEDAILEPSEQFILDGFSVSFGLTNFFAGTATIIDDDDVSTLAIDSPSTTEGTPIVFSLIPDVQLQNDSILTLSTIDIDATGGLDFEVNGFEYSRDGGTTWLPAFGSNADQIDFLTTDTEILVRIDTVDDILVEFDESFTLDATVISGSVGAVETGTGTIIDDDVADVTIADGLVVEGGLLEFGIELSQTSVTDIELDLATVSDTALVGEDVDAGGFEYSNDGGATWIPATGPNGTIVTIDTGAISILSRVVTIDDTILETDETFGITATVVSGPGGAVLGGTGTIVDNDSGIDLVFGDDTRLEGRRMVFHVSLTSASPDDVIANIRFTDVTAVAGTDYNDTDIEYSLAGGAWLPADGLTGTEITIPAGTTEIMVRTETINDQVDEPIETFSISADILSGSISNVVPGTGTIGDDDVVVTIGSATVTEGDRLIFPIDLNYATTRPIRLFMEPISGTATGGVDFEASDFEYSRNGGVNWFNGFGPTMTGVVISAGTTELLVRVDTLDDATLEGPETFTMSAQSDSNNHGPIVDGTMTIEDDEVAPVVTISDAEAIEGEFLEYTISVDRTSVMDIVLDLMPADGTALLGLDYEGTFEYSIDNTTWLPGGGVNSTEVELPGGSLSVMVRHATIDDTTEESIETLELGAEVLSGIVDSLVPGTGTIGDDDVTITIGDTSSTEGGPLVFPVTLGTTTTEPILLEITPIDGTAIGGADFETSGFEYSMDDGFTWLDATGAAESIVPLAAGASEVLVRIDTIEDGDPESDEAFVLAAVSISNNHGAITNGTATIFDDDLVNLAISDASATEGMPLVFTLTQSRSDIIDTVVDLSVISGTGTVGVDIESDMFEFSTDSGATWQPAVGPNGTEVVISAGTTELMVRIDSLEDSIFEGDETVTLAATVLSGPVNSLMDGTGTILDDDEIPNLAISDAMATEGFGLEFTLTQSGATAADTVVDLVASDISAMGGIDFETDSFEFSDDGGVTWQPAGGTNGTEVTIIAGTTSLLVRVDTLQDVLAEGTETFGLAANVLSGTIGTTTPGVGTIDDDEPPLELILGDDTRLEGRRMVFHVSLTSASPDDVIANIRFTDVTAVAGTDYNDTDIEYSLAGGAWLPADGLTGTEITIPAGTTEIMVRTETINDQVDEPIETFSISADILSGSISNVVPGTGTIGDDDVVVTIGSATVTEGDRLIFPIDLNYATTGNVRLFMEPISGTATAGVDFEASDFEYSRNGGVNWFNGFGPTMTGVVISAGTTELLVRVDTLDDATLEGPETFTMSAQSDSNNHGPIVDGTMTIEDDEVAPVVTISDAEAIEGEFLEYTISVDRTSVMDIVLDLMPADGTALLGLDYEGTFEYSIDNTTWLPGGGVNSTEVELPGGSLSVMVRHATIDDTTEESIETLELGAEVLSGIVDSLVPGTGTIGDDDVTITIGDTSSTEGGPLVFPVTLGTTTTEPILLEITPIDGTAIGGADFETSGFEYSMDDGSTWLDATGAAESIVPLAAGASEVLVRIDTIEDGDPESDEAFVLAAVSISNNHGAITNGTATIFDDDLVNLSISDASATEGMPLVFTLTQSRSDIIDTVVDLSVISGTGTVGVDIESDMFEFSTDSGATWQPAVGPNGTEVVISAGTTELMVRIDSLEDSIFEGDETVTLAATVLSGPVNSLMDGTGTILDDDEIPNLAISDAMATEGFGLEFTLTQSGATAADTVVDLVASDISAMGGIDFEKDSFEFSDDGGVTWQPAGGTNGTEVTIIAGTTSLLVRVDTLQDVLAEGTETFGLAANVLSGTIGTTTPGVGTIDDDEPPLELILGDDTRLEGRRMVFHVSLTSASPDDVIANIRFTDVTAVAGTDYNDTDIEYSLAGGAWLPADGLTGTEITIPAGTTEIMVRTETINDQVDEPIETFSISADILSGSISNVVPGTGTIGDDDVVVTIGSATVTEGDRLIFPIDLNYATTGNVRLFMEPISGTATGGVDFEASDFEYSRNGGVNWFNGFGPTMTGVVISAGTTELLVRVDTLDDATLEGPETFTMSAQSDSNNHGPIVDGTMTIEDDEVAPVVTISDAEAIEGEFLEYTISVDRTSVMDIVLDLMPADGTALLGLDYEGTFEYSIDNTTWLPGGGVNSTEVELPGGSLSVMVRHATIDDTTEESIETLELGAEVLSGIVDSLVPGTGTIGDDDVTITIGDTSSTEGGPLVFPVTLGTTTTEPILLEITPIDGTAIGGADFETSGFEYSMDDGSTWLDATGAAESIVPLAAGASEVLVRIDTIEDGDPESDEAFVLAAVSISNNHGAITNGTATIFDDDLVNLSISDASATEGMPLVFTLTQSRSDIIDTVVDLSVISGTGTVGVDIESDMFEFSTDSGATWQPAVGPNGTEVVISAGTTELMVRIDSLEDSIFEGDETVTLAATVLSGPVNSLMDGTGTILDDDEIPNLAISDAMATEGFGLEFTLTQSGATAADTVVDLVASDISAMGGIDFETDSFEFSDDGGVTWQPAGGTNGTEVTVIAGTTSLLVRVDTLQDVLAEGTETFGLAANVLSGTIGTTTPGVGTIDDDEPPLELILGDDTRLEGRRMVFHVSLTSASPDDVIANIRFTDVTAVAGTDYNDTDIEYSLAGGAWLPADGLTGTEITIPAGTTEIMVRTETINDQVDEPIETFSISADILSGSISNVVPGTGTIGDDDVVVTIGSATVTEGDRLIFPIDLNYATTGNVRLFMEPISGTATAGVDFEASDFEYSRNGGANWFNGFGPTMTGVVILAGTTELLVRVDTLDDALVEGTETFTMSALPDTDNHGPIVDGTMTIEDDDVSAAPSLRPDLPSIENSLGMESDDSMTSHDLAIASLAMLVDQTPRHRENDVTRLDAIYSDLDSEESDEQSVHRSQLPGWLW